MLLKQNYHQDDYYKNIKTVFVLHSIDEHRMVTDKSFKYIDLSVESAKVDNLEKAIKFSDYLIIVDDEKKNLQKLFQKHKNLASVAKKTKTSFIEVSSSPSWSEVSKKVETILRKI